MKRQQRTIGAILEIPLNDGYFCYAQILDKTLIFFNYRTKKRPDDLTILLNKSVLFFLSVYNDVITTGKWLKVGTLPVKNEFLIVPMQYIQDALNSNKFELYNPNTGEITPATRNQIIGLECAAVWEAKHVEDRINDYYNGVPNKWVEGLKAK